MGAKRPKQPKSGPYVATFVDSTKDGATWEIVCAKFTVGKLFEGHPYDSGKVRFSLNRLLWSGPFPTGYPKNPDAVLTHDGGPYDSLQEALDKAAERAEALKAWRRKRAEAIEWMDRTDSREWKP